MQRYGKSVCVRDKNGCKVSRVFCIQLHSLTRMFYSITNCNLFFSGTRLVRVHFLRPSSNGVCSWSFEPHTVHVANRFWWPARAKHVPLRKERTSCCLYTNRLKYDGTMYICVTVSQTQHTMFNTRNRMTSVAIIIIGLQPICNRLWHGLVRHTFISRIYYGLAIKCGTNKEKQTKTKVAPTGDTYLCFCRCWKSSQATAVRLSVLSSDFERQKTLNNTYCASTITHTWHAPSNTTLPPLPHPEPNERRRT